MLPNIVHAARRKWRDGATWIPYLLLTVFIVAPLLVMAALLAVRAGMFSVTGPPDARQVNVFLTFIGGGLATAATVLGALFTWEHNKRERHRLGLDTVIKGLESFEVGTLPRVAGVLATMVLLGHPRIALRLLGPVWDEDHVDSGTATWLIGQVLQGGAARRGAMDGDATDRTAVREAAVMLRDHSDKLTHDTPRKYFFPGHFLQYWKTEPVLLKESKEQLLYAMGEMLASREKSWWSPDGTAPRWPTTVLKECALGDDVEDVRWSAASLFAVIYEYFPEQIDRYFLHNDDPRNLDAILADAAHAKKSPRLHEIAELTEKIRKKWGPTRRPTRGPVP